MVAKLLMRCGCWFPHCCMLRKSKEKGTHNNEKYRFVIFSEERINIEWVGGLSLHIHNIHVLCVCVCVCVCVCRHVQYPVAL